MSLAVSVTATDVSSGVVAEAPVAEGASFTAVTVMVTLALSLPPWPSSTRYVNMSDPLKFAFGVYAHVAAHTTLPLNGPVTGAVTVNGSPSTSP